MSRFFRSALFPLIVIVLLVYLASQTLLPRSESAEKVTYSELIGRVNTDPEVRLDASIMKRVWSPRPDAT